MASMAIKFVVAVLVSAAKLVYCYVVTLPMMTTVVYRLFQPPYHQRRIKCVESKVNECLCMLSDNSVRDQL